jgi:spore germination protein GerM
MKMLVSYPDEISECKIEILTYSNNESRILLQEVLQLPLTDVSVNAFKKIQQNVNSKGSDLNEKEGGFGI